MNYCLYNAIKTPDGTVLHCKSPHDYKTHKDTVSGEDYMNDGTGYGVRRTVNKVPFEDLSVWNTSPFEQVRKVKFWGSYGKDGKGPKINMALEEMEDSHIRAILETQYQIKGTALEEMFLKEIEYRLQAFEDKINNKDEKQIKKVKKKKI